MLKGVRDQMKHDNILKSGCFGGQAPDDEAEVERHMRGPEQGISGKYRDDLIGQVLKDAWVEQARRRAGLLPLQKCMGEGTQALGEKDQR